MTSIVASGEMQKLRAPVSYAYRGILCHWRCLKDSFDMGWKIPLKTCRRPASSHGSTWGPCEIPCA